MFNPRFGLLVAIATAALGLSALLWAGATRAQQPERCTTSQFVCDMAGLPFMPVPALTVLSRTLLDDNLARAVRSIVVVPCAAGDQRAVCTEYFVADPETGTINVARLLIGESVGNVIRATRAVCVLYAGELWGEGSEDAVQRCVDGGR